VHRQLGPQPAVDPGAEPRWLLLTHHLPPKPAYLRVKVRRQLERIGAVPLKNSVYVLPPGEETREDFEWLSREIDRAGGESTLCLAVFLDEAVDRRIRDAFRRARAADYAALAAAAGDLYTRTEEDLMKDDVASASRSRARSLKRQLAAVSANDFFDAPGREAAERAVSALESLGSERSERGGKSSRTDEPVPPPRGATWVTRQGVKVDRMASAWLIRRFLDPAATFKFVRAQGYEPQKGELRFDMFGGELTHEGDDCTFETLLRRFGQGDPALAAVAEVVHDIDCKDEKFGRPETSGIASLVDGIARACGDDDEERIARGSVVFDGLHESFRSGGR
jgi:hypothetical protein